MTKNLIMTVFGFGLIAAFAIPFLRKPIPVPAAPIMEIDSSKIDSSTIIIEIATNELKDG